MEPITPFRGIYSAITRQNESGGKSYFPEDRLTIDQALFAYTQGSAYAEFEEGKKGELKAGEYADFLILSNDLTKIPPSDYLKTEVLRTVVGGRIVYDLALEPDEPRRTPART